MGAMATSAVYSLFDAARAALIGWARRLDHAVSMMQMDGARSPQCCREISFISFAVAPAARITARSDMKISARNQIKGTVTDVKLGATTAHVKVDIGSGQIITAAITNEAVNDLGLKAGS